MTLQLKKTDSKLALLLVALLVISLISFALFSYTNKLKQQAHSSSLVSIQKEIVASGLQVSEITFENGTISYEVKGTLEKEIYFDSGVLLADFTISGDPTNKVFQAVLGIEGSNINAGFRTQNSTEVKVVSIDEFLKMSEGIREIFLRIEYIPTISKEDPLYSQLLANNDNVRQFQNLITNGLDSLDSKYIFTPSLFGVVLQ